MTLSPQWEGDGIYIKVRSVIGSVSTEGRQRGTDNDLMSHQQNATRLQEAVSFFVALWYSGFPLQLLFCHFFLRQLLYNSAPLLYFWPRSTLSWQTSGLHN